MENWYIERVGSVRALSVQTVKLYVHLFCLNVEILGALGVLILVLIFTRYKFVLLKVPSSPHRINSVV